MMVTNADVTYETRTVQAIRGMESRVVRKWESAGWQLVRQTPGRVKTELIFRRPKRRSRPLIWIIGGGAFVLLLAIVIIIGAINEKNAGTPADAGLPSSPRSEPPTPPVDPTSRPTMPSATPTETAATDEIDGERAVLTPATDPELEAIVALADYCSPEIAAFAQAHRGETIKFAGHVGAMALHGSAKTRYDMLLGAGDFSDTSAPGPAFQFRDVNATSDLNWAGTSPDSIGVGTNLSITASIVEYEESSCLFLLDPVATAAR